ncbi:MAG: FAD-dependent oxidoreductase, partial [Patescibacteria group bacterium]
YAARRNLNFKIISKDFGGEVATSGEVDNYPGIPDTDGLALTDKFKKHLADYGVKPETGVEVEKIIKQDDGDFCITAKSGQETPNWSEKMPDGMVGSLKCDYLAKAVIIATGVHPRELNVLGEKELRNKGVSYCTICDGPLFPGKPVAVIGGGNSALEAGIMMADIASKVYMINKNKAFKGDQILIDNLSSKKNVEIIYKVMTSEILGDGFVSGLKYKDQSGESSSAKATEGKEKELKLDGVFVHIGMLPNSGIGPEGIEKTEAGEIMVSKNCETNIPGLFAAGDVTDVPFKQIVIAAGQGTCALLQAVNYLNRL